MKRAQTIRKVRTVISVISIALTLTFMPQVVSADDAQSLSTKLGPPPVDAVITSFPYSDTRVIDADTHKITVSVDGTDETSAFRGYVYKLTLTKGAAYSIDMIFDPSDAFACGYVFLDGNSNILVDDSLNTSDELFIAPRSGVYYMLITDMGLTGGGSYKLQIDKASLITGKVMDDKGKAIGGAYVTYYSAKKALNPNEYMGSVTTNSKGEYSIGVKPGSYKLLFSVKTGSYSPPKYRAEYYSNKYSIRSAGEIRVDAGRVRSGVNVKLSPYKVPKADKKVAALPFRASSKVTSSSQEIQFLGNTPYRCKVYSVHLRKGRSYELILKGGEGAVSPVMWVMDSKGYGASAFVAANGDKKTAAGSLTASKTGNYRIVVADMEESSDMRFSLSVSGAFSPGSIEGKVTNKAGHALGYFEVMVLKKYGKRWITYMSDVTGFDGKYQVDGLKAGSYKVRFSDTVNDLESVGRVKYYRKGSASGAKERAKGTTVKVRAGKAQSGINVRY
ncbi:MAG: carboxypeptidase-like regulatory domain-containing protein [Clostridiales Family XIII bacterium]|jgi:hypothetical protein|nr:carboxypeptidase-like regulatory domain-containing protein [Clostridiales Family XIII bacterium]